VCVRVCACVCACVCCQVDCFVRVRVCMPVCNITPRVAVTEHQGHVFKSVMSPSVATFLLSLLEEGTL